MAWPTSILLQEWLSHQHALLHLLAEYRLDRLKTRNAADHETQIIQTAASAGQFLDDLDVSEPEEAKTICRLALELAQEFEELVKASGTNLLLAEAQDEFADSAETLALALDPETAAAREERGPRIRIEEVRRRRSS